MNWSEEWRAQMSRQLEGLVSVRVVLWFFLSASQKANHELTLSNTKP